MTKRKSTSAQARGRTPARAASAKVREGDVTGAPPQIPSAEASPAPQATKQALIIGLLQRPAGASVADLVAATGWLAHTTRAAVSRLRQAGHVLDTTTGESGAVYRIATPARAVRARKASEAVRTRTRARGNSGRNFSAARFAVYEGRHRRCCPPGPSRKLWK
jgi:hypothetical protein